MLAPLDVVLLLVVVVALAVHQLVVLVPPQGGHFALLLDEAVPLLHAFQGEHLIGTPYNVLHRLLGLRSCKVEGRTSTAVTAVVCFAVSNIDRGCFLFSNTTVRDFLSPHKNGTPLSKQNGSCGTMGSPAFWRNSSYSYDMYP